MVIPLPLIYRARLPMLRKIQLALLFCVSIFVVSITVVRMPVIFDDNVAQKSRTLWASIGGSPLPSSSPPPPPLQGAAAAGLITRDARERVEVMAACLVANAPVFNSFLHTVRQRQRPYAEHQAPPRPTAGERRARMPVTGQDSFGSLTRHEGADSQVTSFRPVLGERRPANGRAGGGRGLEGRAYPSSAGGSAVEGWRGSCWLRRWCRRSAEREHH